MFGLAEEFGVGTYRTHVAGAHLLIGEKKTHRYTGLIPKISPWAILTLVRANRRIDKMARTVPVEAPWTAERADEWDQQTVADWMARSGVKHPLARDLFDSAVRGLFTGDLADVSLLDLFFLAHAHGSIEHLFSIEGGGQETLVDGGAGAIATRMADALGAAVHLDAPVRSVAHGDDGVVIEADDLTVACRDAVITVPPALALDITFDPVLPDDRLALYRAAVAGPETKTLLVYEEAFWRDDGLSGQTAEPQSVAEVTIDASPAAGKPGVIAAFTFGPVARAVRRHGRRRAATPPAGHHGRPPRPPGRRAPRGRRDPMGAAGVDERVFHGPLPARHPHPVRPPPAGAPRPPALGRHRDVDGLPRRHGRRRPLRRTRRRRDPRRRLGHPKLRQLVTPGVTH